MSCDEDESQEERAEDAVVTDGKEEREELRGRGDDEEEDDLGEKEEDEGKDVQGGETSHDPGESAPSGICRAGARATPRERYRTLAGGRYSRPPGPPGVRSVTQASNTMSKPSWWRCSSDWTWIGMAIRSSSSSTRRRSSPMRAR